MEITKPTSLIFFLFFFLCISFSASAHPGRTDDVGCHTCRTNCSKWGLGSGEYHCHQSKGLPQPTTPIRSHFDENGGSVEPYPKYNNPSTPKMTPTEKKAVATPKIKLDTPIPTKSAQPIVNSENKKVGFLRNFGNFLAKLVLGIKK